MKNLIFIYLIFVSNCMMGFPVSVANGGTGVVSTVAYAVICGGTTSTAAFQSVASVGTSGQALVSAGAALPAFGTLGISGGGTGATSLSAGVIQTDGSALSSLGIGLANQVLKNSSGTVGWSFKGLLQIVSANTTAKISTSGIISNDNTIPQNTEGTEVLTLAITPKSATSTLVIIFATNGTPTATSIIIGALFQDSIADALAAQYLGRLASGSSTSGMLQAVVASGSTTTRTYKIRIGGGSFQVNAGSSSRKFGGVASTYLIIMEFA